MRRARIAILWGLPIVVVLILIGFSLTLSRGWTTYPGAGLPGLLSDMDVDPDGRLWVQTKRDAADSQGQTWVWEGQGWRPSTPEGLFPAGETVELTDPSGRIWVLEQGKLDVFDGTAWSHIGPGIHTTNQSDRFRDVAIDRAGRVWAGGLYTGLRAFDGRTWTDYPIYFIHAIAPDPAGRVWVATSGGVEVLDQEGHRIAYTTRNSGLAANQVEKISVDRSGQIWFLTSAGVSRLVLEQGALPRSDLHNSQAAIVVHALFVAWLVLYYRASPVKIWSGLRRVPGVVGAAPAIAAKSALLGLLALPLGPIAAGMVLGLLGWGDGSLIAGIVYLGLPAGLFLGIGIAVRRFGALADERDRVVGHKGMGVGRWVIAIAAGILCAAVSLVIVVNAGWADWASNAVLVSAWAGAEIVSRLFKNRLSGQPGQASA